MRITDGRVFSGGGAPRPEDITVQTAPMRGNTARFVLRVPPRERLTVVYSDSDDGKSQKRLIATSALTFARTPTLGTRKVFEEGEGSCVVRNGELVPSLE